MEQHVKVVGAIHLVLGGIKILTGIGILVAFVVFGVGVGLLASTAGKAEARAEEKRVLREERAPEGEEGIPETGENVQEEGSSSSSTEISDGEAAGIVAAVMGILGLILGGGFIFWGALRMLVGYGLLRFRGWARVGAVALAVFDLPGFPLFTLFGGYTLWALLSTESRKVFLARS